MSTRDLSLYRAKVHSLYCLRNSFLFHDKSISSPGKDISGILPLPPNLPIFMSSRQGRILSNDFWFCGEPLGFLLRAFGEFSFLFWFWNSMRIVSWLPPIPDNVTSVWSKLSIAPWMSVWVFLIDGQGNGHSIWACCVDYSFHKININPLKLIVTDTQTILFKISITYAALESSWNNSVKPAWNGMCFFP